MFLIDYHIHSKFSFDSQAKLGAIVEKAISAGLSEIAITDHFDPFEKEEDTPVYDVEAYFKEIREVQEKYEGKIKICAGVEAGQAQLYSERVKNLIESYPFDFVIGSVHNLSGDRDLAFQSYTLSNVSTWLSEYFLEAAEAAKTGLYDVFGHLNYICRYIGKQKIPVNLHDYEDLAVLVLRQIVAQGKGIEINVSTLRDKGDTPLPPIELIKKYKSMGGEILTIGSDSHTAANVGTSIKKGFEIAERAGFKYITTFSERKPSFHKI